MLGLPTPHPPACPKPGEGITQARGPVLPPVTHPLRVRVPDGLGSPSVSLLVASESLPPSSRSLGTDKSRASL